jgi:hypothetical protein
VDEYVHLPNILFESYADIVPNLYVALFASANATQCALLSSV